VVYEHWKNYVLFKTKHKGNAVLVQTVKAYGGLELYLHLFLT